MKKLAAIVLLGLAFALVANAADEVTPTTAPTTTTATAPAK